MFKRLIWTGVGYGLGVGSSVYVQRRVKRAVEQAPERIRAEASARSRAAAARARTLGTGIVAVVRESRAPEDDNTVDLREKRPILRLSRRSA